MRAAESWRGYRLKRWTRSARIAVFSNRLARAGLLAAASCASRFRSGSSSMSISSGPAPAALDSALDLRQLRPRFREYRSRWSRRPMPRPWPARSGHERAHAHGNRCSRDRPRPPELRNPALVEWHDRRSRGRTCSISFARAAEAWIHPIHDRSRHMQ